MMTIDRDDGAADLYPGRQQLALPLWDLASATCWLIGFDVRHFDHAAFATQNIDCPLAIARSVPKRQAEFFHGRLAARHALAGFGLGHVQVGTGPQREPLWPPGIIGSISHNDRCAAAVALPASGHGGIGIDIETVADAGASAALAGTVVNAAELAYLRSVPAPATLDQLLTIVFAAKESFYKAAFRSVGKFFDFSAVAVRRLDMARGELEFELCDTLCASLRSGTARQVRFAMLDTTTVFTSCSLQPD